MTPSGQFSLVRLSMVLATATLTEAILPAAKRDETISAKLPTFLIAIMEKGMGPRCAGALWSLSVVMTTCFCLTHEGTEGGNAVRRLDSIDKYVYVAGAHDLAFTYPPEYVQLRMAYLTIVHPDCDSQHKYDMGVAVMRRDFWYTEAVRPVPLSPAEVSLTNINARYGLPGCYVSGWGGNSTNLTSIVSTQIGTANVVGVSTEEECIRLAHDTLGYPVGYSRNAYYFRIMQQMCYTTSPSACNGDRGSPLYCGNDLYGILLYHLTPCEGKRSNDGKITPMPGIYALKAAYLRWFSKYPQGPWGARIQEELNKRLVPLREDRERRASHAAAARGPDWTTWSAIVACLFVGKTSVYTVERTMF